MARNTFANPTFFRNAEGQVYSSYTGEAWQPADTKLTKAEGDAGMREQAKAHLRTLVKPGSKVYTVLNHKSSSGMSRSISLVVVHKGELVKLDYWIVQANGEHIDQKNGGIKVSGCGMDMGFHLVYNLGLMLWPQGTKKAHGMRNGKPDHDGGYALNHAWL